MRNTPPLSAKSNEACLRHIQFGFERAFGFWCRNSEHLRFPASEGPG